MILRRGLGARVSERVLASREPARSARMAAPAEQYRREWKRRRRVRVRRADLAARGRSRERGGRDLRGSDEGIRRERAKERRETRKAKGKREIEAE